MANINRNFGKLDEGTLTYAPRVLVLDGRTVLNPNAESYAQAGYLPVDSASPSNPPREGYHWAPDGWEARDGAIRRVWREEANTPPPPRRWSRLSIKTALATAGMLDAARQLLEHLTIGCEGSTYTAWEALTDCDYVEEGYPTANEWSAMLNGLAAQLGKTRADIDAFLDAIPTEG